MNRPPAAHPTSDRILAIPVDSTRRNGGGPRAVADMLRRLMPKPAKRQAALTASIMLDWTLIVGPELALCSEPVRLVPGRSGNGGTLHLRVSPAAALEVQHAEPLILERLRRHLGVNAVDRVRMVQGLPSRMPLRRPEFRPIDATTRERIAASVAGLPDDLADALTALGTAIAEAPPIPPRRRP